MAAVKKIGLLATTLILGSMSATSFGQATPPPGGNNGGNPPGQNGGGRGNFNPAQFRQRMLDRVKQQLGASDEEFTALSPKIEKVMQLQRDAGGRGGFGGRRGGGQGGPGGGQGGTPPTTPPSAVQTASTELQTTLDNKDAKPEEIKAKLDALRAAKAQAKQDLAGAQQELKGLLTQRQEAVLVEMGMLD